MAAYETSSLHQQRRILAAPLPQTSMDPTLKKQHPKPTPFAAAAKSHAPPPAIHHALPHPTPPSTIQNISHRFSKLYANHKKLISNSKPTSTPQLQQSKTLSLDTSCTTLTKSTSQHERQNSRNTNYLAPEIKKDYIFTTKTKTKDKDGPTIKNPSSRKKQPSFEKYYVKKASKLMSKSFEDDDLKKNRSAVAAAQEQGRRSSVSSMVVVNRGRRRSFFSSQVELSDFLSCNGVKVVAVDMPPFMQVHAVDVARKVHDSLEKFASRTLAFTLKKEFDGVYGPAWHCIAGTSFGSFVTHSVGGFMYFSMDSKLYILLFKTTVQRAEPN